MAIDPSAIDKKLTQPKKVDVDGESVENHSVSDLLKLKDRADGEQATANGSTGLRFFQMVPPGTG